MDYRDFLKLRRKRMAGVIEDAYRVLAKNGKVSDEVTFSVTDLITQGETTTIEFKSTLRTNLHTGEKDLLMEMSVLKTIAAICLIVIRTVLFLLRLISEPIDVSEIETKETVA